MKRTERGFTLVELVMSISIAAIVGLAVAGAAAALSAAHSQGDEFYRSLKSGRFAVNRIQNDLRRARLVLASDAANLVYWAGDANSDRQVNVAEIGLLSYSADSDQLCLEGVVFADSMAQETRAALNTNVSLSEVATVEDATTLIRETYAAYQVEHLLANEVVSFSLKMDTDAPLTKLVGIVIEIGAHGSPRKFRSATRLRADATGSVGISEEDGSYVLLSG